MKTDISFLKKKVDLGAEYITTQMFFNTQKYFDFVDSCRAAGINVPIIPGLKIIKSVKQLQTLPRNFHIDFPEELVNEVMENQKHVVEIGVNWAMKQTEELVNAGVTSVHFYIMNDTDSVLNIVKKFK